MDSNKLSRMVARLISKNRFDGCAHSQEDQYNEAPKDFLHQRWMPIPYTSKIHVGPIGVSWYIKVTNLHAFSNPGGNGSIGLTTN